MRKTLAIALSLMLMVSACCFAIPVSAAEGTPINSAADFAAMAADGTYYLNADITIDKTYETPFTGTFDGNGKTVTVSVPMFADFGGTIKNMTINGNISSATAAAAVAITSTDGMIAENIVSNVNITVMANTGPYECAGAICGRDQGLNRVSEYTNIVNNGDIYVDSLQETDAKARAAGIVAIADNAIFKYCINYGDITCVSNQSMSAGIAARLAMVAAANTAEAYYCQNHGYIKTADHSGNTTGNDAGGIFAYIGTKNQLGFYRVYGCLNTGTVEGNYRVGSMVSYTYASGANAFVDIEFCVNTGDILYGYPLVEGAAKQAWGSHFIGYTNSAYTIVKCNISTGTVKMAADTADTGVHAFMGLSSADSTMYDMTDNYILKGGMDNFTHAFYATDDKNAQNRHESTYGVENGLWTEVTAEELASGKIAIDLNKAGQGYEGFYFYQTLGTDATPVPFDTSKWVVENNGTFANGEKPAETTPAPVVTTTPAPEADTTPAPEADTTPAPEADTTPAPEADTTPAPTADTTPAPKEEKGCGSIIAVGVLACMIPAAVVICRKKRD